jgi:LPXTG-site transpeptidase (sortase) family protein
VSSSTPPAREPGLPASISIPALHLDAVVVPVGIEDEGAMEIPGAVEAGWYRFGPKPGARFGSAVIAGHVDHRKTPGVFIELRRLDIGAEVSVTDVAGDTYRYIVIERYQVNKHELPVKTIFRRNGEPVLTLITCGGEFDRNARSYDDNIVITAVPLAVEFHSGRPV